MTDYPATGCAPDEPEPTEGIAAELFDGDEIDAENDEEPDYLMDYFPGEEPGFGSQDDERPRGLKITNIEDAA